MRAVPKPQSKAIPVVSYRNLIRATHTGGVITYVVAPDGSVSFLHTINRKS